MKEYRPIDEINLVYEDGELVGWYRPDIDPEVEDLKAKLETMKAQMEYIMEHPEDRCIFCSKRDKDCFDNGGKCVPEYMGESCDACG